MLIQNGLLVIEYWYLKKYLEGKISCFPIVDTVKIIMVTFKFNSPLTTVHSPRKSYSTYYQKVLD